MLFCDTKAHCADGSWPCCVPFQEVPKPVNSGQAQQFPASGLAERGCSKHWLMFVHTSGTHLIDSKKCQGWMKTSLMLNCVSLPRKEEILSDSCQTIVPSSISSPPERSLNLLVLARSYSLGLHFCHCGPPPVCPPPTSQAPSAPSQGLSLCPMASSRSWMSRTVTQAPTAAWPPIQPANASATRLY